MAPQPAISNDLLGVALINNWSCGLQQKQGTQAALNPSSKNEEIQKRKRKDQRYGPTTLTLAYLKIKIKQTVRKRKTYSFPRVTTSENSCMIDHMSLMVGCWLAFCLLIQSRFIQGTNPQGKPWIAVWMRTNKLKRNAAKMEVLLVRSSSVLRSGYTLMLIHVCRLKVLQDLGLLLDV